MTTVFTTVSIIILHLFCGGWNICSQTVLEEKCLQINLTILTHSYKLFTLLLDCLRQ